MFWIETVRGMASKNYKDKIERKAMTELLMFLSTILIAFWAGPSLFAAYSSRLQASSREISQLGYQETILQDCA